MKLGIFVNNNMNQYHSKFDSTIMKISPVRDDSEIEEIMGENMVL